MLCFDLAKEIRKYILLDSCEGFFEDPALKNVA